ncbi:hypothetical protein AAJ76_40007377 [Vairimorpha ceranae]|uniref:Uncharacterized protein n=1 Tax=Vairimorpha ceranae TaxID=40302 RepID=A0A0F9WG15_9MICR|nr:hypothetical protein AAJ76_40007377 [Vairimorpha ceranae]KKO76301.1 hypothetical protein AAJ76_40007377 [Vairimorpha ceranae]
MKRREIHYNEGTTKMDIKSNKQVGFKKFKFICSPLEKYFRFGRPTRGHNMYPIG